MLASTRKAVRTKRLARSSSGHDGGVFQSCNYIGLSNKCESYQELLHNDTNVIFTSTFAASFLGLSHVVCI